MLDKQQPFFSSWREYKELAKHTEGNYTMGNQVTMREGALMV
jgi:hypothetical protein